MLLEYSDHEHVHRNALSHGGEREYLYAYIQYIWKNEVETEREGNGEMRKKSERKRGREADG